MGCMCAWLVLLGVIRQRSQPEAELEWSFSRSSFRYYSYGRAFGVDNGPVSPSGSPAGHTHTLGKIPKFSP